ncbi:hypothetical protein QNO21_11075 [Microbacterium sp. zg-Y818]|uniref:hypothetical protein n=1 Tax=unclassified Microbacterium TaxID=2609290 RepID=UPI00214B5157|nr:MULTISPECIES: hypothetical protein [unclassified Microbacterium]MCR2799665.1 hypothetical protein [Microbacterium sp. zg.Y818]WIM21654.1 hypothetical protein QNO21_11075 [Microbacterium sp. zg-Y818]
MATSPAAATLRRIATVVVAAAVAASVLGGCGPRMGDPLTPPPPPSSTATPAPSSSPSPSPSGSPTPTGPAPAPDATIPERPEDADATERGPSDGPGDGDGEPPAGAAPSQACPDDLTAWIVDESALVADAHIATPAPSDPSVDFGGLSAPGCAFAGTTRTFTDVQEVQATSDVRVWVFTDAATAAGHADAALALLTAAGYTVLDRRGGSDPLTHLLRGVGPAVLDQAVVQTWGADATVSRVGAEPGQVVVAVGVVTFAELD